MATHLERAVAKDSGDDNDEGEKQTHGKTSRFRNVATLFILAKWTLRNSVAPEQVSVVMMIMIRQGEGQGGKVIRAMPERKRNFSIDVFPYQNDVDED